MDDKLLRLNQIVSIVGAERSSIYEMIADEIFPKQIRINRRSVRWLESEVASWIAYRRAGRTDDQVRQLIRGFDAQARTKAVELVISGRSAEVRDPDGVRT